MPPQNALEFARKTYASPVLEARRLRSGCPRAELPAEVPGEGPSCLFQLMGALGIHPWASGHLPPVSASVSTWLLLCVRVSPLLCLIRTLSLGLGPPPSRKASCQTLHSITSAETLFLNEVLFPGSGLAGRHAVYRATVQELQDLFKGC